MQAVYAFFRKHSLESFIKKVINESEFRVVKVGSCDDLSAILSSSAEHLDFGLQVIEYVNYAFHYFSSTKPCDFFLNESYLIILILTSRKTFHNPNPPRKPVVTLHKLKGPREIKKNLR